MQPRFRHEVEWFDYFYIDTRCKVAIVQRTCVDDKCKIVYLSREEVEYKLTAHKFNPFLHPIFQEAIRHFPQGDIT